METGKKITITPEISNWVHVSTVIIKNHHTCMVYKDQFGNRLEVKMNNGIVYNCVFAA